MSLTSYRAAPPRVNIIARPTGQVAGRRGGPGGDLLFRALGRSTIGAEGFHGRVRDGIGCLAPRHDHQVDQDQMSEDRGQKGFFLSSFLRSLCSERSAGCRFASALRVRGIKPIERLVPVSCAACTASTPGLSTWWSTTALMGRTGFEVGFPLRCFQRLSRPHIATRRCRWRDNRYTRGASIPVLSY